MAVDKNLFMYDLSVVAIMKNEAPYVKEWLDYHLLAGVDHFFIYDNDSPDNLHMVLQPYIDAGLVTYTFYPDKCRQMESYIDAVHRFRFFSRYMAWIDGDEFIFPKSKPTIPEVVDEILSDKPNAAGLAVNIFGFGSNFQETADYSRGVLERFTRRAEDDYAPISDSYPQLHGGHAVVKTIANPRKVKVFHVPHCAQYFEKFYAVNEQGNVVPGYSSYPVSTEKIVMNHYSLKSREEYGKKVARGNADHFDNHYDVRNFEKNDHNEKFDDSILKYRATRLDALPQTGGVRMS